MITAQDVLQAASQLPEAQRVFVIERLLESLGPEPDEPQAEVDRVWHEEVRDRSRELDTGEVNPVPWKQVQADAEVLAVAHGRQRPGYWRGRGRG